MRCDMCGSDSEELFRSVVEGAEMTVCKDCSGYGKILSRVKTAPPVVEKKVVREVPKRAEIVMLINKDYPSLIKSKRELKDLKQEELAKLIGERLSVIHQLETGHIHPSIDLARKLEKFLKISLVEEYEETGETTKTAKKELTIGDMINLK